MAMKVCPQCEKAFTATKAGQKFCDRSCRARFHRKRPPAAEGPHGIVKTVRRIKAGTSVTLHFIDPVEAERAIKALPGTPARLVAKEPMQ